jgi:hypothetical protein
MTAADELTAAVFRAPYAEYDLRTFGILHVVTPKGTPVYAAADPDGAAAHLAQVAASTHP